MASPPENTGLDQQKLTRFTCSTIRVNATNAARKPIKLLSNVEVNQDHALGLPQGYKGSNMFMPTGERLYWQAEVLPPPHGPATCQDFHEIRARCLAEGVLFEDPEFPADITSLSYNEVDSIVWRRPGDLVENPQLCVNTYSRFDVRQGKLGDCWLVAVIADLPMRRHIFDRVVPNDQGFDEDYAGVFHFRFWQQGRWVDVVIDDRLPTREDGNLFSIQPADSERNEFWSALLEKAYAKLYGSYKALDGGVALEAMEDFTGGLAEEITPLADSDFYHILKAYRCQSLLSAYCPKKLDSTGVECGLVGKHMYSITSVKYVNDTPLVRLRNPWGHHEWSGTWSDKSPMWKHNIPQTTRRFLDLTADDDGEFWMSYDDFCKYFDCVTVCNLSPSFLYPGENCDNKKWKMSMFEGAWVAGETAGGDFSYRDSHWRNPQYRITVSEPDEDEETFSVTISILQKHYRTRNGFNYIKLGFSVFIVDDEGDHVPLDAAFLEENEPVHEWSMNHGYIVRLELDPGSYVIVPCMEKPGEEGEFLLRVLTEKCHHITKLN